MDGLSKYTPRQQELIKKASTLEAREYIEEIIKDIDAGKINAQIQIDRKIDDNLKKEIAEYIVHIEERTE